MPHPRLMPNRPLPPYAYLPGRQAHPIRDHGGHSFGLVIPEPDATFLWGADLFNQGFYWEAHEVWEAIWRASDPKSARRLTFKGLILLAAAGVKLRENLPSVFVRHACRAAKYFGQALEIESEPHGVDLGMPLKTLLEHTEAICYTFSAKAVKNPSGVRFPFFLG